MARTVSGWNGVRAWRFIHRSKAYRAAWKRRLPQPGLPERTPPGSGAGTSIPVRLQTSVDLAAMAWGMLAWEDPYAAFPQAPFWAHAGVIDGEVRRDARPLAQLAAEGGATLSGLRLADGALVLRIEQGKDVALMVRLRAGTVISAEDGLLVGRQLERMEDAWLGVPAPLSGRARRGTMTSFCWRWKARRRGCPGAGSRPPSGTRSGSRPNMTSTAG